LGLLTGLDFPGPEKISRSLERKFPKGAFRVSAHSPLLKNSAAILRKSMDGARRRASPDGAFTATFIHNTGPS